MVSRSLRGSMTHLTAARCALAAALGILAGCNAFAPSGFGASRSEKRIIKQAEVDPFPSPADVGLTMAAEGK
jgi:hypothetical protein